MAERELILRALLAGGDVSGEDLSRKLHVSRAMVHKVLVAMRAEGLRVDARPRRGYRLLGLPDRPLPWVVGALWPEGQGHPLRFVPEIGSTMEEAGAWARAGAPAGAVVTTDHQVAGRGRRGRSWEDPPGASLLASIVLRPRLRPAKAGWLPLAVAVGAADALQEVTGLSVGIKWPNDILVGARKLAGILVELTLDEQEVRHAVAGVGMNVHQEGFPKELSARAISLCQAVGFRGSRATLLAALVDAVLAATDELERDPERLQARWRAQSVILGRQVTVEAPDGPVVGEAVDVDGLGRLLVRAQSGELRALAAGDVSLGRPQASFGR